jgi:amino acid transporter
VVELLSALAIIAFCTTFGRYSPIWVVMNRLPMFEKFWWSFKMIAFTNFFVVATAAVVVDRVARERWSRGAVWLVGMATILTVLLTSRAALCLYPSEILEGRGEMQGLSQFLATLTPGSTRVHPVPAENLDNGEFKMNRQIALSGILSTRGYDPLVDRSRANMSVRLENDDDFRRFGIDYLVIHSGKSAPPGFTSLGGGYYFRAMSSPLPLGYLEKSGTKVEVGLAASKDALTIRDPVPAGETLVLNFLARSGIVVTDAAGVAVRHWRDAFGRIVVEGGRGGGLKVAYRIDFFLASIFSAFCLLAAIVFAILASMRPKDRRGPASTR